MATSNSSPTFRTTSHLRNVLEVRSTTVPMVSTNGADMIPVTCRRSSKTIWNWLLSSRIDLAIFLLSCSIMSSISSEKYSSLPCQYVSLTVFNQQLLACCSQDELISFSIATSRLHNRFEKASSSDTNTMLPVTCSSLVFPPTNPPEPALTLS